jgi:hypothetical protein
VSDVAEVLSVRDVRLASSAIFFDTAPFREHGDRMIWISVSAPSVAGEEG